MIVVWFIIILFLSIIIGLLWTSLRLIVDTIHDVYRLEWQFLASAELIESDNRLGVLIQFPFFKKFISLEDMVTFRQKKTVEKPSKKVKKKTPSVSTRRMWSIFKKIVSTFDIKICKVNWDTDDYILNAYLYPLTPFLTHPNKSFHINFEGKRDIVLVIENRMGRILKSFF